MTQRLPIDDILPELTETLRHSRRLVLQAPPGAGKTTRVPLALLEAGCVAGRILVLEPRRLATRAAAERMAETLDQPVGRTVGYRMRGESKVSTSTRIEVVTEGILTRMVQTEPDLPGVGAVIFDEFHERSLNADLGLALCLEVADALRDDLCLIAMSATLDAGPVAHLMSAPILTSEGRSFEVARHWLDQPIPKTQHFETGMANLILHALSEEDGSLLAFLPGEGEIRRTQAVLQDQLPPDVQLRPLYGAMDFKAQRAALEPTISGRKIVLATSIAETSLTIEGVRIVVDGGRARRSEFDPSSGMSRLVTTRVSRAEAAQRAGRAGRIAPGSCFKLWTRGEDGALPAYPPAEIDVEDLARLSLEVALWGGQPQEMSFLTPPHAGRLADAQRLLQMLKALDDDLRITDHGRALAKLPLHPRLAHMVSLGGRNAARLAALLSERDILQGAPADLKLRLEALARPKVNGGIRQPALSRVREEIRRLEKSTNRTGPQDPAVLAALAYPDRIGLRRLGDAPRFVLSGGKGAYLSGSDPLAGTRMLVATDLDGDPREARIRQAIAFSEAALRECFPDQIIWQRTCAWSRRTNRVEARQQETFGALVLEDRVWQGADPLDVSRAMLDGVRHLGLAPSPSAERLIARVNLMRQYEPDFPDFGADNLMATLEDWLLPHLSDVTTSADWRAFDILPALEAHLGWDALQSLNRAVPAHFITPLGRKIPIDYNDAQPQIAVRLQELFGTTRHPTVAGTPVQITLLSPAQRPLQVTTDLPGFWASSYADVRKDMRGRYPKHPWPEDPTMADPTLRAKPRK